MKKLFVLLAVLMLAALPLCSGALGEGDGFTIPEALKTLESRAAEVKLPEGLPAEPVTVTSVKINGQDLAVELSGPVPSLSILQAGEDGEVVLASATDASSISTNEFNPEEGGAALDMAWQLPAGRLVRRYLIWEDGTFDFAECVYTAESADAGLAPYTAGTCMYDFDEKMNVTGISWNLGEPMEGFSLSCYYDENGALKEYVCQWETSQPSPKAFGVMLGADGKPLLIEYQEDDKGFQAASDPITSYVVEDSRILEVTGYSEDFIQSVIALYPQIPEPVSEFPGEEATMTDLAVANAPVGYLWAYRSGSEDEELLAFATADELFSLKDGKIVLNTEAKDLNGKAADPDAFSIELPAFELPEIR